MEEGFSGTPVWDETLEDVVEMAVAAEKQRWDARAGFIIPTNILMAAWPQLQEQLTAFYFYKGLFALRKADAEYFFGRESFTEQLMAAVGQPPGNLPLWEFVLELLWGKQSNGQLTHQGYEEVGGVEKALTSYG